MAGLPGGLIEDIGRTDHHNRRARRERLRPEGDVIGQRLRHATISAAGVEIHIVVDNFQRRHAARTVEPISAADNLAAAIARGAEPEYCKLPPAGAGNIHIAEHFIIAGATVNGIIAVAPRDKVIARVAVNIVMPQPAIDGVAVGPAIDAVIAAFAEQQILIVAAIDLIIADACVDLVIARIARQAVFARAANHKIVAVACAQTVIARPAVNRVIAGAAGQQVIAIAAGQLVIARVARQAVIPLAAVQIVVADAAKQDVIAQIALQQIIIGPAKKRVIAIAAKERVIARVAIQAVIADVADNEIGPGAAIDQVIAGPAVEHVIARIAVGGIVAIARIDQVIAGAAIDRVIALIGEHLIVASPCEDQIVLRAMPRQDRVIVVHPVAARIALIAVVDQIIASGAIHRAIRPRNAHRHQLCCRTDLPRVDAHQCQAFAIRKSQDRIARSIGADRDVIHVHRTPGRIGQATHIQQVAPGIAAQIEHWRGEIADPVLPAAIGKDDQVGNRVGPKVNDVIPGPAVSGIRPGAKVDHIIARPASQRVIARAAEQCNRRRIGTGVQRIGLCRACDDFDIAERARPGARAERAVFA